MVQLIICHYFPSFLNGFYILSRTAHTEDAAASLSLHDAGVDSRAIAPARCVVRVITISGCAP